MTVASTVNRLVYAGNGVTTSFPVTFPFQLTSDLVVVEVVILTGATTTKALTTDYTITGTTDALGFYSSGGTVVANTPPASTVRWIIYRDPSRLQGLNLQDADNFPAEAVEANHDKLVMLVQRVYDLITRSLRAPDGDSFAAGIISALPSQQERAGKFLSFNEVGHPIVAAGTSADLGPVSSFANTLLDDATASDALTTLGVSSFAKTILDDADASTVLSTLGVTSYAKTLLDDADYEAAQVTLKLTRAGVVQMVRTGNGTWKVFAPDGSAVSIAGSTTDGLQEAINYASANGHSLHVTGGSVTSAGVDVAVINCTTQILWPPMQGKHIVFDFCTINFTGAVTLPGMVFDSTMMVSFEFNGQIVYVGNAAAVQFYPHTQLPLDPVTGVVDSKFWIKTIACVGGTTPRCVDFDCSVASIIGNRFDFGEVNSGGIAGTEGIRVTDVLATKLFQLNKISAYHIHGQGTAGIRLGVTSGAGITGNVVEALIHANQSRTMTTGYLSRASKNVATLALAAEATMTQGVKFEVGADSNVTIYTLNEAATPLSDLGATNRFP